MKKTVICHLFYPKVARELLAKLTLIDKHISEYFINIQGNSVDHNALLGEINTRFKNAHILNTSNQGRDIGAKFFLLDLMIQLDSISDYTLIIHDKASPHLENGNFWREELFKIIDEEYINTVFKAFLDKPDVGIVCSGKYIQNEFNAVTGSFMCSSNIQIKEVLKKYNIQSKDYNFVAGNIFWIRTGLLREFFSTRSIIEIRAQLEPGNALDFNKGTFIHSWERAMSWIATSQGYKIHGI